MRLVACQDCHAQYDVTGLEEKAFACCCGSRVEVREQVGVDAEVHRCGACGALVHPTSSSCDYCGSEILRDTHRLSLICPECFGRNREESRYCTACGVVFRPEPIPSSLDELPCPCCGVLMPPRSVGGVRLNECPACHGLWVPGEGFDRLLGRAIAAQRERDAVELAAAPPRVSSGNPLSQTLAYRKCPVCEALMHRENFRRRSGVILDRCGEHGVWLDADELEAIAGFVLSGGFEAAETVRAEEQRRAEARARVDFARIAADHGAWRGDGVRPGGALQIANTLLELLTGLVRFR